MTLKANIRKKINNELYKLTYNTYFESIPIKQINEILGNYSFTLLNEDFTRFSGIFCGRDGRCLIDTGNYGKPHNNCSLVLTWYKMLSGRYEIVTYLG